MPTSPLRHLWTLASQSSIDIAFYDPRTLLPWVVVDGETSQSIRQSPAWRGGWRGNLANGGETGETDIYSKLSSVHLTQRSLDGKIHHIRSVQLPDALNDNDADLFTYECCGRGGGNEYGKSNSSWVLGQLYTPNYDGNDGSMHHPTIHRDAPCERLNTSGERLPGKFARGFFEILYTAIPLLDYVLEVYVTLHMEGMHGKLKFVTEDSSYRHLSLDNFPSPPF
ncbi:uncharacterized protein LACBIDRAFT_329729 [Laccaria bicolor S238N-H82]|uniref:Predicted protein n=1 Tax=Laccaria bicolor (strain S238N-H82 / ATCC MYA-4686) TaxID=486041 RepID=B0DJ17_LACBS|nr:uncharacterized protein LACBIDRAFT_329729 [Laccaria bicolor S238N-H82]EDR05327.1 predicted protein [Laccaria bicolor S238N-H82]|eukprot:XP_001883885.1 predicted protein [Laccaria bicolor S238N-H82]